MVHPNLATMLAFLTTDADLPPHLLRAALREAVADSFHCITVDGDTSTNDMVLCLANGKSGVSIRAMGVAYRQFVSLLSAASLALAKMIVADGEGATKRIEICVMGATTHRAAHRVAMAIAKSSLVKTAFFGEDANWGRIIAAIGNAGVPIHPERIDLTFGDVCLLRRSVYLGREAEAAVARLLKEREIRLTVHLHAGAGQATVWTSDLSLKYVKINAAYRT